MSALASYASAVRDDPSALTIRWVKGSDAPAVAELRSLCSTGSRPGQAFIDSMRTWIEADGEARITLLASLGGKVAALISMLEHRGMPEPGVPYARWGYIDHLFVRESLRRRGIGTAIIEQAIAIADRRNYRQLLVSPSSMAVSLFYGLGFLMADELGPNGLVLLRPRPIQR